MGPHRTHHKTPQTQLNRFLRMNIPDLLAGLDGVGAGIVSAREYERNPFLLKEFLTAR